MGWQTPLESLTLAKTVKAMKDAIRGEGVIEFK
jgi:hypothetical protein